MLSVETAVLNPKYPGCICLIAFVNLVPIVTEKVSSIQSNTILLYLESVEEYSKGKIQLLHLNITSQCDNI